MKAISTELRGAQRAQVARLSTCWLVTRTDGRVFAYTDSDVDLVFEGVRYRAQTGYEPSAIETAQALNVDTVDLAGIVGEKPEGAAGVVGLDQTDIAMDDVLAGRWDGAQVRIFQVDRSNLAAGAMPLRRGWIGHIEVDDRAFKAELRGMMQALQTQIGRLYQPACDANLGDDRCRVDMAGLTFDGTVTAATDTRHFTIDVVRPDGYLVGGRIDWTGGANTGFVMEVQGQVGGEVTLQLPMPFVVAPGDTFTVTDGCPKSFEACLNRFGNVVNFRGFPHVPGMDKLAVDAKKPQRG